MSSIWMCAVLMLIKTLSTINHRFAAVEKKQRSCATDFTIGILPTAPCTDTWIPGDAVGLRKRQCEVAMVASNHGFLWHVYRIMLIKYTHIYIHLSTYFNCSITIQYCKYILFAKTVFSKLIFPKDSGPRSWTQFPSSSQASLKEAAPPYLTSCFILYKKNWGSGILQIPPPLERSIWRYLECWKLKET